MGQSFNNYHDILQYHFLFHYIFFLLFALYTILFQTDNIVHHKRKSALKLHFCTNINAQNFQITGF